MIAEKIINGLDDITVSGKHGFSRWHHSKLEEFFKGHNADMRKQIFIGYYTGPSDFGGMRISEIVSMAHICKIDIAPFVKTLAFISIDEVMLDDEIAAFQEYVKTL